MTARLFCKTGELAGSEFFIEKEAIIGKNQSNQIVLPPTTISTNHARIFFDDNQQSYFIEDLKSRNGTKLDGMRVTQAEKLGKLAIITFADSHDFIFQEVGKRISGGTVEVPKPAAPLAVPRTMADSDVPLITPQLQPSAGRSKTMMDADMPAVPQLSVQDQGKGARTKLETDMPSLPPSLEKGGAMKGPKTMMDTDVPSVPQMSPGSTARKTVLDQEVPAVPKMAPAPPKQPVQVDSGPETIYNEEAPTVFKSPAPPQTPPPGLAAQQGYVLILERQNKSIQLQEGENFVGRKRELAIFIDHSTVSRRHAVVRVKSGKITVEDLGSSNHTFVDGNQISSEVEVNANSKIRFGSVEARVVLQQFFNSGTTRGWT